MIEIVLYVFCYIHTVLNTSPHLKNISFCIVGHTKAIQNGCIFITLEFAIKIIHTITIELNEWFPDTEIEHTVVFYNDMSKSRTLLTE